MMKHLWMQLRSPLWLSLEILCPVLLIGVYIFGSGVELYPLNRNTTQESWRLLKPTNRSTLYVGLKPNCCDEIATFNWLKFLETTLNLKIFNDTRLMKQELAAMKIQTKKGLKQTEKELFGIEIERLDFGSRDLHYRLFIEKPILLLPEKSPRWGAHLKIFGKDSHPVYSIQYEFETAFVRYLNPNEPLHPVYMTELLRPERLKIDPALGYFYALMPALLLLSIVATTRNIVLERQTIKPYLSVMGLTTVTFYLSHCLVTLGKILILSLAVGIAAFCYFPNFPWILAIITLVLFSFAATAFSAMLASFFTSPATAMQLCVSGWLAQSITPKFFEPHPEWSTTMAAVTSLWPSYALHYIFKFAIIVSNYHDEVSTWSGLADSQWTGQHTLVPLLVLLLDTILMIGITVVFEKKIFGKFWNKCTKKLRRKDDPIPHVERLSNADESFTEMENCADIWLKDVWKEYPTGEKAVNGLNLKALRGQVTVLLGHNGAGKTTTFSMICGVEEATSGEVRICGYPAGSSASRRMIGYCSQTNTIIDQMTVKDHLWLAHGLKQAPGNYWAEGRELLTTLGLIEQANQKVSRLSGGQKRKLCVGMALIGNSRVVLLDEPTAGMDPESRRDVEKLLEEAKKQRTILLTTHYMDEAETLGDRIFIVAAGQTVCSGSPQFLKKRFGTGYALTLVANEGQDGREFADRLMTVVKEYAKNAHLGEIRGKQVEIEVPVCEQKNFPDLFERIEAEQEGLQISSFGLSLNSLEQVFLRVSTLTQDQEGAGADGTSRTTTSRSTDTSNRSDRRAIPLEEALDRLYHEECHTGWSLYWAQLWAVMVKKYIFSLRFWSQLVTQLGLPVISIIVGLALYTLAPPVRTTYNVDRLHATEDFAPDDIFTAGAAISKFGRFLGTSGTTMENGTELTRFLREQYKKIFYFGAIFKSNGTLLLPNPEFPLSFATSVNTLSNGRLSTGLISATVECYDVFNLEDSSLISRQALLMMLLLTIMMCQFIVTLVEDRVSNFAHQQLLMGMRPLIYWFGDFLYCLAFYCIQNCVYIFSATFTGILTPTTAVRLFFVLFFYYWATIPSVFVLSRFINSSSRAALVHWVLLFGSFCFVWFYPVLVATFSGGRVVLNETEYNPMKMTGWELSHMVLGLLFPSAPMYHLIPVFVLWSDGRAPADVEVDLLARIIFYCLSLSITGAAGLIVFLLVQLRHINYFFTRLFRIPFKRPYIPVESIENETDKGSEDGEIMLEMDDLCKVYGKNCALAHLTMTVKERECFGLLGVSGAGKSTAFNIITGQMFATQGTATIDGTDCRRDLILGFCPQFDAIHKDFTGKEALTLLAKIHGYPHPVQTADDVLEIVEMTAHARKRMCRCSGGQKRRVCVAASLLPRRSRIVILDEATAGIDPKARRDIWEVLSSVREHSAILMTSHSMDECEALCSRIGILKHGGLAAIGTSQSLKSKYGNFYTLTMALPSSEKREEVTEAVANWFPGSVLKNDGFSLHLKWQIPKSSTDTWSSTFSSCIELSERIGVPDFCVTQSTLQDIFLLLVGEGQLEKSAGKCITSTKSVDYSTK